MGGLPPRLLFAGELQFFAEHAPLCDPECIANRLALLRQCERVVYAKRPFAGPKALLAYLARHTHRVAISNRRLIALDERGVTFRWKDYRTKANARHQTMTCRPPLMNQHWVPLSPRSYAPIAARR